MGHRLWAEIIGLGWDADDLSVDAAHLGQGVKVVGAKITGCAG